MEGNSSFLLTKYFLYRMNPSYFRYLVIVSGNYFFHVCPQRQFCRNHLLIDFMIVHKTAFFSFVLCSDFAFSSCLAEMFFGLSGGNSADTKSLLPQERFCVSYKTKCPASVNQTSENCVLNIFTDGYEIASGKEHSVYSTGGRDWDTNGANGDHLPSMFGAGWNRISAEISLSTDPGSGVSFEFKLSEALKGENITWEVQITDKYANITPQVIFLQQKKHPQEPVLNLYFKEWCCAGKFPAVPSPNQTYYMYVYLKMTGVWLLKEIITLTLHHSLIIGFSVVSFGRDVIQTPVSLDLHLSRLFY